MSLGRLSLAEVAGLVKVTDVHEPDPGTRAVYESMYGEFVGIYPGLHGLYSRLNRQL